MYYKIIDEITIDASTDNLSKVISFLANNLEKLNCKPKTQVQLELAVEEIFVNIATYAYPDKIGAVRVRIEADTAENEILITFEDSGTPYDPLKKPDPDVNVPVEKRQIGGLGVFLVKKISDKVFYEYKDGKNCFTIVKKV